MSKVECVSRGSGKPENEVHFGVLRGEKSAWKRLKLSREGILNGWSNAPPRKASWLLQEKLGRVDWSKNKGLGRWTRRTRILTLEAGFKDWISLNLLCWAIMCCRKGGWMLRGSWERFRGEGWKTLEVSISRTERSWTLPFGIIVRQYEASEKLLELWVKTLADYWNCWGGWIVSGYCCSKCKNGKASFEPA